MAGVLGKFLENIGIEENGADDEVYEDVNYEDESRDNNVVNFGNRAKKNVQSESNVVSLPNAAQLKMIVYHPVSFDNLQSRKPVIVNMEELDLDCAQRILDFMAGAIYALNGTIYKISRGIFVVAPTNYDVIGNGENDEDGII